MKKDKYKEYLKNHKKEENKYYDSIDQRKK